MLNDDIVIPIVSPYASPVVLRRKHNGKSVDDPEAWRFAIGYRKLNTIAQYPQYSIPVIDDIQVNIPWTNFMCTLDLTSGYFQIGMKHKDILLSAFIISNGCFTFKRLCLGLSEAPSTFQKALDN